jgi:hypothetical protein
MKTKTAAEAEASAASSRNAPATVLDQQISEFLTRKAEGMSLPDALKEIQASFAIEGMEISDERLAESAGRYMAKIRSGEAQRLIEQAKAKFPRH